MQRTIVSTALKAFLLACFLCGPFSVGHVVAQKGGDKGSKGKAGPPGSGSPGGGVKGPNDRPPGGGRDLPAYGRHEGGRAVGSAYDRAVDRFLDPDKVGSPGGPSHDWRDHATLGVKGLDGKDLGDRSRDRRDYPSLGAVRDFTILPAGIPNTFHTSGGATVAVAICTNLKFGTVGWNYCVNTQGQISAEVSWATFSAAVSVDSSGKVSGQGCFGVSADVGMGVVYSNSARICINSTREITIEKSEGVGYGASVGPNFEVSKTVNVQTTTPTGLSLGFSSR